METTTTTLVAGCDRRRYAVTRTVVRDTPKNPGITAHIEIAAADPTDAKRKAARLFAHERGTVALYRACRAQCSRQRRFVHRAR